MNPVEMKEYAEGSINIAKADIEAFSEKLKENAITAVTWGDGLFIAVASLSVYKLMLDLVSQGCTVDTVVEELGQNFLQSAANPLSSTSFCKNALDSSITKVYARVLKDLKRGARNS